MARGRGLSLAVLQGVEPAPGGKRILLGPGTLLSSRTVSMATGWVNAALDRSEDEW